MGATGTNRRKGKAGSVKAKYASWRKIAASAEAKAARAIRDDATAEDVSQAVADYARQLDRIPPTVRAMEIAVADCERLVEGLTWAGLKFASRKNAPSQIAASAYAGWLSCHKGSHTRNVDWIEIVGFLVSGIEHALTNKTGTPKAIRDAFQAAAGRD